MGRIEGVDGIQCSGRALVFEGGDAGVESGVGHPIGTDHSGEEGIVVKAGRGLGVNVVLQRSIGRFAGRSLIRNGRGIRGDGASIGRDVRVVAVDLT